MKSRPSRGAPRARTQTLPCSSASGGHCDTGARASHTRRLSRVEVAASLSSDPKGRRTDGIPAFPPCSPGLSAPPTPTPGTASVTQLGSHPPRGALAAPQQTPGLLESTDTPSGQACSITAWSLPGPTHNAAHPRTLGLLCPSKLGSLPNPGSWERGVQPKLLGTEPHAHCLPSPPLSSSLKVRPRPHSQHQLGDGALWGHAAAGSEGTGGPQGAPWPPLTASASVPAGVRGQSAPMADS